jgi:hypothetical protein
MTVDPESLLIFSEREKDETEAEKKKRQAKHELAIKDEGAAKAPANVQVAAAKPKPQPQNQEIVQKAAPVQTQNQNIIPIETPKPTASPSGLSAEAVAQQSQENALNMVCVWHPWRSAYATCTLCGRPFCFPDIVELNRKYYCLEDIDNAMMKEEGVPAPNYNLMLISGILLMFSFLVFFYFSNSQILYILTYLHRTGLPSFLAKINYSYAIALIESLFMVLCLIAGLSLFVRSKNGFYLSLFMCLASVVLFSYQYVSTGTLYLGAIAVLCFVSFGALLFSNARVQAPSETKDQVPSLSTDQINWPNAGRF